MEDPFVLHEMEDPSVLHEMEESSVHLTKPLPLAPLQLRSSPELHDPIKSEPDRKSLHQRLRGTPAPHHYRSSDNTCRSDSTTFGVTEDATLSSSLRHSKHHGSLHSVPNGGVEIPNSNAYNLQGAASAPYQSSVYPMSREVSPEDPAPTTDYPLTNVAFPSSPKAALGSLWSDMVSPISPTVGDVHPPLVIASSATPSHHGSSAGTSEHQNENAGGRTSISSPPLQSMPKEENNTLSPFRSLDSDIQSLVPFCNSMESSAAIVRYQSEQVDVQSVSNQPRHSGMCPSDLEGFTPSNGSEKVLEAEETLSMTQSVVTPVYTQRSENKGFPPTTFFSTFPPQNSRTQPDSQSTIGVQSPPDPTVPSTAFNIPPFSRSLNHQTGIVARPKIEMYDFDYWDTSTQNLEQSDPGQSFCFPDSQPWSPLDHLIATPAIDLHSTEPQWYANEQCPQAAPQDQSSHSGISLALFERWQPFCFYHNSFPVGRLASKQRQVEILQALIPKVNSEWMSRMMDSQPEVWSFCNTLSASSFLERAVRTSQDIICGSPAMAFEDVFAIMHLAFAAAIPLTWQQDDYMVSALRDDALQWQHVLRSSEDKTRFLDAMDCWLPHELKPPPLFTNDCHKNFGSIAPQESLYCDDQQTLWDRLKKGEVFKVFIAFVESKSIMF